MLEQVSTSVKFVAFYTANKTGKTGLTVTVDIYNPAGSQIVTGGSATAIGGGLYAYTLSTNNSAEGEYAAIFKTSDSTVDAQHIPSLWVLGRAGVENLDASVSSRLAGSAYTSAPTTAQIATAVEGSLLNEADGQAVLNAIVGAIGNTNLSEVSLVAAVRADLERNGGKLDSIPTTAAPTASTVAGAVRTELGTELSRIDAAVSTRLAPSGTLATVTTLTNAPSVPSAAAIASQVRSELSVELARVDAAITTRATPANIPAADITAIKAKTDAVNVDRINNTATLSQVGNLLAQANS